jgi:DNA polymerase-3 subunit gamma/tau
MASQALYRKWRSQTFDELVGQAHITHTLMNALKLGRIAHAYLFAGPRGTGKTSMARLLAKAVNCQAPPGEERPCNQCHICTAINEGRLLDLIEIDAASNTGVDDIRDLRDKVGFRPSEARIKFYIIDEVHMLSNAAFNALLKTLEEPPEHVIFVLATTEPERIPATITSRCQRFEFKRIKLSEVIDRLAFIAAQEGFSVEPAALEYIARQGGGSMRDAISLLDQLTAYGGETISLNLVRSVLGAVASQSVIELVDALIAQNIAAGLNIINRVVSDGVDPRQFVREIIEYLRALMLVKLGDGVKLLNLPDEILTILKTQATQAEAGAVVRATERFNAALFDLKSSLLAIPQLPLELAFVEAATPVVVSSISTPALAASRAAPPPESALRTGPEAMLPSRKSESIPAITPLTGHDTLVTPEMISRSLEQVANELEPKSKPMAEALRNDVRLHQITGKEIYFITSDFMKGRFEKPQPQAAIDEAFSRAVGQPVMIRFLSENSPVAKSAGMLGEGVSTQRQAETPDEGSQALIRVATEELGGKVIN